MVAMGPGAPAWAWDAPEGHEGYDELRRAGMTDAQIGIDRARREPPEVAWVTPDQLRAVSRLRESAGEGLVCGLLSYAARGLDGRFHCLAAGRGPEEVVFASRRCAEEWQAGWADPDAVLRADPVLAAAAGGDPSRPLRRALPGTRPRPALLFDPGASLLVDAALGGAEAHPRPRPGNELRGRLLFADAEDVARAWLEGSECADDLVALGAAEPAARLSAADLAALAATFPVRAASLAELALPLLPLVPEAAPGDEGEGEGADWEGEDLP